MNIEKAKTIGIPTYEGVIGIGSEDLDKVNILTKIILKAIKLGVSLERLETLIKIPKYLLEEDLKKLDERGIVEKKGDIYCLTEVGETNYSILEVIEEFNRLKKEVIVDRYTSKVFFKDSLKNIYISTEDKENYEKFHMDKEIYKLETGKFITQFFYNLSPANSKNIVIKFLQESGFNLNEDIIENLYVQVTLNTNIQGYILGNLKERLVFNTISNLNRDVLVERPYFKVKAIPSFKSVVGLKKDVKEAIQKLNLENSELLSEKAKNLVSKIEISKKESVTYYDPLEKIYLENCLKSEVDTKVSEKKIFKIEEKALKIKALEFENEFFQEIKNKYQNDLEIKYSAQPNNIIQKIAVEKLIDFYEEVLKNGLC